jgi:hypothetical protein
MRLLASRRFTERRRLRRLPASDQGVYVLSYLGAGWLFRHGCVTVRFRPAICDRAKQVSSDRYGGLAVRDKGSCRVDRRVTRRHKPKAVRRPHGTQVAAMPSAADDIAAICARRPPRPVPDQMRTPATFSGLRYSISHFALRWPPYDLTITQEGHNDYGG